MLHDSVLHGENLKYAAASCIESGIFTPRIVEQWLLSVYVAAVASKGQLCTIAHEAIQHPVCSLCLLFHVSTAVLQHMSRLFVQGTWPQLHSSKPVPFVIGWQPQSRCRGRFLRNMVRITYG